MVFMYLIKERWLSGRKRRIANPMYELSYREFKSLPLLSKKIFY